MIETLITPGVRAAWGVAALVSEVGNLLAGRFSVCTVRGEISGFSRAASGHCYFNLKDADGGGAMLRCAMFRRASSLLAFAPADGQLVEVRGRLGVYEPRGELQLVAEAMQGAGAGALYERFLRLRARLEAEGLFDPGRKRELPRHPRAIGIVTSLGGAALHDALTALARRAPHVAVIVYPSPVQGAAAPARLAEAIELACARAEVDTLIVCRGGGSLEDLWAFNEEQVVRAIVSASLPVVCGVGHETDVTLADLAADLRAPTPTAAAELAALTREACLDVLDAFASVLQRRIGNALDAQSQRLDRAALRFTRPGQVVRAQSQHLALLAQRLAAHLPRAMHREQTRVDQLAGGLHRAAAQSLSSQRHRLDGFASRLQALDPHRVLARGYAWLGDGDGHPVSSVKQLDSGMVLQAVLSDGKAGVVVTKVEGRTSG